MQNFTKNRQNLFFFLKKGVKFLISRRLNQKTFYYNQYIFRPLLFICYTQNILKNLLCQFCIFRRTNFGTDKSICFLLLLFLGWNRTANLFFFWEQNRCKNYGQKNYVNANKCGNAAFIFEIKTFNDFIKFKVKNNLLIEKLKSSNSFPFQIILQNFRDIWRVTSRQKTSSAINAPLPAHQHSKRGHQKFRKVYIFCKLKSILFGFFFP